MKILTISGLDGSGKSTQIELLKQSLEAKGSKVFYFHAISFSLATKIAEFKNKYCLICKLKGKCQLPTNKEKIGVTKANYLQILLRKIFLQLDLIRFKKLTQHLSQENFDYVLSDRYFYDSLANIEYLSKKEINPNYSIIKPDLSIYLQADPNLIMRRDRKPEQGLQYLIDKKDIYDKFASIFEMKIVDGNDSQENVAQAIMKQVAYIL